MLIKQFRRLAKAQVGLLEAFERQGWPRRILDPVRRKRSRDRGQQLRETLANLNEFMEADLIRFEADGTGKGIRWSIRQPEDVSGNSPPPKPRTRRPRATKKSSPRRPVRTKRKSRKPARK